MLCSLKPCVSDSEVEGVEVAYSVQFFTVEQEVI